jgi:hypothetical protein
MGENENPALVIQEGDWSDAILHFVQRVAGATNVDRVLVYRDGELQEVARLQELSDPRNVA